MQVSRFRRLFILLVGIAPLVSGCAVTEGAATVKYKAPSNISVTPGADEVSLQVVSEDGRISNRDRIATKKNGYGMEMARVVAENDVVEEVAAAVRTELASLGFNVGEPGLKVTVETIEFYNDYKPGFWSADAVAEVAFQLTAAKPDGQLVYSETYRAVGMNEGVAIMGSDSAVPALEMALRDAVQLVVRDEALHSALVKAGGDLNGSGEDVS